MVKRYLANIKNYLTYIENNISSTIFGKTMRAMMKHSQSGALKDVPLGFSWTTLFFGIFPALFRGDFKNAIIMLIVAIFSLGWSWLIMPFFYNKMYVNDLVAKGWMPADEMSSNTLRTKGITFMNMSHDSPPPIQYNSPPPLQQNNENNITCNLCQRRFDNQAHLENHILNSDLHKKNLEAQAMKDWKQK